MVFDSKTAKDAKTKAVAKLKQKQQLNFDKGKKGNAKRIASLKKCPTLFPSKPRGPRCPDTRNISRSSNSESPKLLLSNDDINIINDALKELEKSAEFPRSPGAKPTHLHLGELRVEHNGQIGYNVCCRNCKSNVAVLVIFSRDLLIDGKSYLSYWTRWTDFGDNLGYSYVFFDKLQMFMNALIPGKST